eukprot:898170-Amphidinium_carterae.1
MLSCRSTCSPMLLHLKHPVYIAPRTAKQTQPPAVSVACASSGLCSPQEESLPDYDALSDKGFKADYVTIVLSSPQTRINPAAGHHPLLM